MTIALNLSNVAATVGKTFPVTDGHANKTESVNLTFDLDQLPDEHREAVINSLISRGLGTVLSELKSQLDDKVSREQFRVAMNAVNIEQIAQLCLVSRTRGRGKSDYPQGTRIEEVKFLRESAIRALMAGESFPLITYTDLEIVALNKTVKDGGFREKAEMVYMQLMGAAESVSDNRAVTDILGRLSDWIADKYDIDPV